MKPSVLIVGASIAGPCLAFWLARAGYAVTIVERAPELRAGGNGVDVREQAVFVVERMACSAASPRRPPAWSACASSTPGTGS